MSGLVFVNGPVQNSDFTLADKPGKGVGIRIAAALNAILANEPVPHLWNTVTLAGDLRYRNAAVHQMPRAGFEAALIAVKYQPGTLPPVVTDADEHVATLALAMVEAGLSAGKLRITDVAVRHCQACGHMTGTGNHPCRACGHEETRLATARHLVADNDRGEPPLGAEDVYTYTNVRRVPPQLRSFAGNIPGRLLLSRTRDYGIDLAPVGLPGLVLDPRVGLHATALAAAAGGERVAMLVTANALANIAAYGRPFRRHEGARLCYALHGRIPYEDLEAGASGGLFGSWFLPLASLSEKTGIHPAKLGALFKHFDRARHTETGSLDDARARVLGGDPTWVMDRALLRAAMVTAVTI